MWGPSSPSLQQLLQTLRSILSDHLKIRVCQHPLEFPCSFTSCILVLFSNRFSCQPTFCSLPREAADKHFPGKKHFNVFRLQTSSLMPGFVSELTTSLLFHNCALFCRVQRAVQCSEESSAVQCGEQCSAVRRAVQCSAVRRAPQMSSFHNGAVQSISSYPGSFEWLSAALPPRVAIIVFSIM